MVGPDTNVNSSSLKHVNVERDIDVVKSSRIFDRNFYIRQRISSIYSDVSKGLLSRSAAILKKIPLLYIDPVADYFKYGASLGIGPSPLFDTSWYARWQSRLAPNVRNPLAHFITDGADLALDPHPLFSTEFYRRMYPDVADAAINPLEHFLTNGAIEGRLPHVLFDTAWYAQEYGSNIPARMNPLVHYLYLGAEQRNRPHPLFDTGYYLDTNLDVKSAGHNPLVHYVVSGNREKRNPNPYFDVEYYNSQSGLDDGSQNALAHYIEIGAALGISPSPQFDSRWYTSNYMDVASSGINPLHHFLMHGLAEGRSPTRAVGGDNHVTEARLFAVRQAVITKKMALLVTHSPDGFVKPHVKHYVSALRACEIGVVLIVAADQDFRDFEYSSHVQALYVRENIGFDFAAWAHVIIENPELLDCDCLYLTNDSLFGPLNQDKFDSLAETMDNDQAEFIGLTESFEYNWHIQSYFLALKKDVLRSKVFQDFILNIKNLSSKDDVIQNYELRFAPEMKKAGFICKALFPSIGNNKNRTIFDWKALLQEGFPFVKVMTLRDTFDGVDTSGWRRLLSEDGYDVSLCDAILEHSAKQVRGRESESSNGPSELVAASYIARSARLKVAFLGPWNYSNGLAVASRGYISALRRMECDLNLHPIRRPFHIHKLIAPTVDIGDFRGAADVAIVHLNPDAWPGLLTDDQRRIIDRARKKAGLWVWEMAEVPSFWYPAFDEVDQIWAPSSYCVETFAAVAKVPVNLTPHVVSRPTTIVSPDVLAEIRNQLGINGSNRVITYAFDGASYLVRKNPFALVRAFDAVGLSTKGWKLVLKTKHLRDSKAAGDELQRLASSTNGVILVDQPASAAWMNGLFAITDIYASPHSAEGFGLSIAEALASGKLVVATNYSGSRDFLDSSTGFPVNYRIEELQSDHGHYQTGGKWAQVDENHLAFQLQVAASMAGGEAWALKLAAEKKIRDTLSPDAVGRQIFSLLNAMF